MNKTDSEILNWWLEKYCPQIINYINMVVQFEEMTPEKLEERRKNLLLGFLDSSDSVLLPYIMEHTPSFLVKLYEAVYEQTIANNLRDSI